MPAEEQSQGLRSVELKLSQAPLSLGWIWLNLGTVSSIDFKQALPNERWYLTVQKMHDLLYDFFNELHLPCSGVMIWCHFAIAMIPTTSNLVHSWAVLHHFFRTRGFRPLQGYIEITWLQTEAWSHHPHYNDRHVWCILHVWCMLHTGWVFQSHWARLGTSCIT